MSDVGQISVGDTVRVRGEERTIIQPPFEVDGRLRVLTRGEGFEQYVDLEVVEIVGGES